MGVFLTGERGVGKSTALRRALAGCSLGIGGIMTDFGDSRYAESKVLRLLPWAEKPDYSAGEICALLEPGGRRTFPAVFDELGSRLLLSSAEDPACGLIVLDELGFLESDALRFHAAVLAVLAGPKPVLGVVRQGLGAWRDAPLGEIWEVTQANRDGIPALLRQRLESFLPKYPQN